jgi:hypothetical protein
MVAIAISMGKPRSYRLHLPGLYLHRSAKASRVGEDMARENSLFKKFRDKKSPARPGSFGLP